MLFIEDKYRLVIWTAVVGNSELQFDLNFDLNSFWESIGQ